METLPIQLYTSQDVKQFDTLAQTQFHIEAYALMCRAGQATFNFLKKRWPKAHKIAVFCGAGNNGGDGFVVARMAKEAGLNVCVYQVGEVIVDKLSAAAQQAREAWLNTGEKILNVQDISWDMEVIVDALLGTGIRAPLAEPLQKTIEAINQSGLPVLAVDLPSGIDGDTGKVVGSAIKAQATITFIGVKVGLLCGQAIDYVGQLYFDSLGVPEGIYAALMPKATRLSYDFLKPLIKPRPLSQHKGMSGHVVVVGGGEINYSGAVCLCAEGALRSGAGLVSACVASESLPLMARAPAEVMCYDFEDRIKIENLLNRASVIVLGPGLGQHKKSQALFEKVLKSKKPLIVDADALNLLAQKPRRYEPWILTPHLGEASGLLGCALEEVIEDPVKAAVLLQQKYGGVIVLKSASTIIADEGETVSVLSGGLPNLATGGTGDILAGIIGSLWGQGFSQQIAAQLGVCVHKEAALEELALGDRGMMASDLLLHIRGLLSKEPIDHDKSFEDFYFE